jgi:L-histidine N-alpha-methyltransferase
VKTSGSFFQLFSNPATVTKFEADVRAGLSKARQKELYAEYFYDDLGTALFEAITRLPEYGLTRADLRLLSKYAGELVRRSGNLSVIVELGSGSGEKVRTVLTELAKGRTIKYCPVDVSRAALERCQRQLDDIPGLRVVPIEDSYMEGLLSASKLRIPGTSLLVLFLGSSIGNFQPSAAEQFLTSVRQKLQPGDVFVLSTDLVKPIRQMLPAYNDALGVTAAFNLNLLARINRELGADFELTQFEHQAIYDEKEQRIEMHLRSLANQTVSMQRNFRITFQEGETIWTESSYKFRSEQVRSMSERAGFSCEAQWIDQEWPFAQSLLRV